MTGQQHFELATELLKLACTAMEIDQDAREHGNPLFLDAPDHLCVAMAHVHATLALTCAVLERNQADFAARVPS